MPPRRLFPSQRRRPALLSLLVAAALGSTAILVFLASWSGYATAIARIGGSSVFTIPYGAFAAATVLGSLSLLLLVLLAQRAIVSGLTQGAVKG